MEKVVCFYFGERMNEFILIFINIYIMYLDMLFLWKINNNDVCVWVFFKVNSKVFVLILFIRRVIS